MKPEIQSRNLVVTEGTEKNMEAIKNYTFYYPDHNFANVMKKLITKKVIHSSRIGKLVNVVN